MRSTQCSESMNNKIKTYIISCMRTSFLKVIEIFNIIKDEELEQVKNKLL